MKKMRTFGVIALVLMLLVTAVPVAFADPVPGEGNTDVTVVNTNQNTGAAPANVSAIYYNQGGVAEVTRPASVPSRGLTTFLASNSGLGDNWNGSMVVQSDAELAAVAEISYTNGNADDDLTGGTYSGFSQGFTEMYFPFAVRAPNAQYTQITVQNTEDSSVTIHMAYTNRNGVVDFPNQADTIPGLGSKTYNLNVPGGAVPNLANTAFWGANGNTWTGGVKITTDGGKKIAAVATNHWNNYALAYNGLNVGANRNYVPSAERRFESNTWRGFTTVAAQCVSASPCNIAFDFVNGTTGATNLTLTRNNVPAGGTAFANTRAGGDFDPNQYATALGNLWQGSVIVRTTNSTNVAVVSFSIRPAINVAGGYSGGNTTQAGDENFLTAIYQKHAGGGGSCPANSGDWRQFSLLRLQNPTNNNASNVDIYYFNPNGSQAFAELNQSVQAQKSYNRNTRNDCATIQLGGNWNGSVYITSDQPLVTVVENLWSNTTGSKMDSYNGYSR